MNWHPKAVKVYVRKGPAKGKSWTGTLMTPINKGGNPIITDDNYPEFFYNISKVNRVMYEKETGSYYVDTAEGNVYIVTEM